MQLRVCRFFYSVLAMAFIFFLITTSIAYAQDFNGGYFGITTGMVNAKAELNYPLGGNEDGMSLDGPVFGAIGGYGTVNDNFYFGVEGIFDYHTTDYEYNYDSGDSEETELKESFGFNGRMGYVQNNWLAYGLLGWQNTKVETETNFTNTENISTDETFNGFRIGAGVEYQTVDKIFIRGQYSYTMYGEETLSDQNWKIDVEPSSATFQLGLGFRF